MSDAKQTIECSLELVRRGDEYWILMDVPGTKLHEAGPYPEESDARLAYEYAISVAKKAGGKVTRDTHHGQPCS